MSLADKLADERRARLAAERLLSQKKSELYSANAQLSLHARALSEEIVETREVVQEVRHEAETLKNQNKQAQQNLALAHGKVVLAERRLWDALTTIRDGFAVFDEDARLVIANPAYLLPFDGLECMVPGLPYDELLQIVLEEGIIDPGELAPEDWKFDMLARRERDEIEPVVVRLWSGHHINLIDRRTPEGDIVSLALDITDTIRRENALKAARHKAEAASRAKSAFLANMSHELRTPMNGVVGMADLLCESGLSDEQKLYAETIKTSGEALLVLINDVLDYSKIEAEKLTLMPRAFDLEQTLHEVVMLLQPTAHEKGIDILVDYDIFLATQYIADPGRVRQVLMNLIGNAVKFTLEGHVKISVLGVPTLVPDQQRIHVTVEDTGIGIAPHAIDKIFGEFEQVEDERNRAFEGTGLGLSITKKLIGLMEGEIWVESELGQGTCFGFHVTLPRANMEEVTMLRVPDGLRQVVVADDNDLSRDILERQLMAQGLMVQSVQSGGAALSVIGPDTHLVFVSDALPDMSGLGLVTRLRASGVEIPAFLMALNPAAHSSAEARDQVSVVLQQPLLRRELFAAIENLAQVPVESAPAPPAAAPVLRRLNVLAAEDNKTNRLVFSKMVQPLEIELRFAEDGLQAVEAYEETRPDIIFMDISMPHLDGKAATARIRELAKATGAPHTPVVAMTAHAMQGDDAEILAAGLDRYMTKPLKRNEIYEAIEAYLPTDVLPPWPPED